MCNEMTIHDRCYLGPQSPHFIILLHSYKEKNRQETDILH